MQGQRYLSRCRLHFCHRSGNDPNWRATRTFYISLDRFNLRRSIHEHTFLIYSSFFEAETQIWLDLTWVKPSVHCMILTVLDGRSFVLGMILCRSLKMHVVGLTVKKGQRLKIESSYDQRYSGTEIKQCLIFWSELFSRYSEDLCQARVKSNSAQAWTGQHLNIPALFSKKKTVWGGICNMLTVEHIFCHPRSTLLT